MALSSISEITCSKASAAQLPFSGSRQITIHLATLVCSSCDLFKSRKPSNVVKPAGVLANYSGYKTHFESIDSVDGKSLVGVIDSPLQDR